MITKAPCRCPGKQRCPSADSRLNYFIRIDRRKTMEFEKVLKIEFLPAVI